MGKKKDKKRYSPAEVEAHRLAREERERMETMELKSALSSRIAHLND